MKKNHGYTMVEMLIVIAIMVILAGMSFVTLYVIKQAKVKSAINNLSNQMTSLAVKTRAISEAQGGDRLCFLILREDTARSYTLPNGGKSTSKAGDYFIYIGTETGGQSTKFVSKYVEDGVNQPEMVIPAIGGALSIEYTCSDGKQVCGGTASGVSNRFLIEYNKSDGSVRYGAGEYKITYDGDTKATIVLDQATGNHYIK